MGDFDTEEDKFHKALKDFMSNPEYQSGFAKYDCEAGPEDLIKKLEADGYEVFGSTFGGKECQVHYRKKKENG